VFSLLGRSADAAAEAASATTLAIEKEGNIITKNNTEINESVMIVQRNCTSKEPWREKGVPVGRFTT
jgi:hypothetical protein